MLHSYDPEGAERPAMCGAEVSHGAKVTQVRFIKCPTCLQALKQHYQRQIKVVDDRIAELAETK